MSTIGPTSRMLFFVVTAVCFLPGLLVAGGKKEQAIQKHERKIFLGPYDLEARGLQQMPGGSKRISFLEPLWVLSYKTKIVDPEGNKLHDNYHCHTMLQTFFSDRWMYQSDDGRPFKGLYSDGFTTELHLPEGFGVYFDKEEAIELMPMFNNRDPGVLKAGMQFTLEYVLAKDLEKPLKPLYGTLQSVQNPHLYKVGPGIDEREVEFQFPYEGTIHVMGVHIHPYGKFVEMFNETQGESVWKAVGNRGSDGQLINMPTYTSDEGYPFSPDEKYRLRVTYDNPTDKKQDAMGGLFILFTTKDDKPPTQLKKP